MFLATKSLFRLAFAGLVAATFALPMVMGPTEALARGAGGNGAPGPGGPGGGGFKPAVLRIARRPPPRRVVSEDPRQFAPGCLRIEPIFDRWGNYIGERRADVCEF